jgi:DtxR family Mn-dependent transcriptional regulator
MLSPTIENYLKHLYEEQRAHRQDLLPTGRLASALAVTPGTATAMVKTLADAGLVNYEPRNGVRLTAAGERHALRVIRRHRLIELFLVQTLGLDWSEVHAEAEELEHALSDKVLDRLDAFLGHPQFDPHGDPIPGATGRLARTTLKSLADCELQIALRIARVSGQSPEFLQKVQRLGLVPGAAVVVEMRDAETEAVVLRVGTTPVTLGLAAAAKLQVEPV